MNNYESLFKQINWKNLLIANYKSLNLSEDEVMVLLVSDYCLEQGETLITPELLTLKMSMDGKKLSATLTALLNKNLIIYEEKDGKLATSLNGIKRLLIDEFLKKEGQPDANRNVQNLYNIYESEFGRPLTYTEIETIKSWLETGFSESQIILALKEAVASKAKNMRYIDKILLNWKQQEERNKEGYTTISEDWRKDMEQSIKIANLDGSNKNDK